jgi:hypothetical protein
MLIIITLISYLFVLVINVNAIDDSFGSAAGNSGGSGSGGGEGSGSGSAYAPYDPSYDYFECPEHVTNFEAFGMEYVSESESKSKSASKFVASVGDHPNSTTYEDVDYNTTLVNKALFHILKAFACAPLYSNHLLGLSGGVNRSAVGFSENGRQLVLDYTRTWPYDEVVCMIATEAYYFGNSFVFTSTLRVTVTGEGETVDDVIQIYVTDPTVINDVRYLSNTSFTDGFGDDDGGMYTAFNERLEEVAISGICAGLTIYINQSTGLIDELTPTYGIADLIVPGATRDVQNEDGDVVSYMQTMRPGSIFKTYPRKPHFIGLNMQYFIHNTVNIPQMYADGYLDFSNSVFINFGPTLTNGLGSYVRFRMGDGIDDSGILGTLPVVYSTYALFEEVLFPDNYKIVNEAGRVVEYIVEKPTLGRFRFTVSGCNTSCFNNATHYLADSDTFDINVVLPEKEKPFYHVLYWDGMSPFLRNLPLEYFYDVTTEYYDLLGGLGVFIKKAHIFFDGPPTNIVIAINPSKNTTDNIFAAMGEEARNNLFDEFGLSYDYTGLYLNLRNTPRTTTTFGSSTGLTLIQDVFNVTDDRHAYLPIEVPLFFGDSAEDYISPGIRVPTSSTILFTDSYRLVFDITNLDNTTFLNSANEVRLTNPGGETMQLSANNEGHPANEVLILGNFTVEKLTIKHVASNVTLNCVVKSCWDVFSDAYVPKIHTTFEAVGIGAIIVLSLLGLFLICSLVYFVS